MGLFYERRHELLVGYDLLSGEWDTQNLSGYRDVLHHLVDSGAEDRGEMNVIGRINSQNVYDELQTYLRLRNRDVYLEREGYSALAKTFARLVQGEPAEYVRRLQTVIVTASDAIGLPIPPAISGFYGTWEESE